MIAVPPRVALNFLSNTSCTVLNALCGFIILPFLIHHMGRETYGLWTLIVATAGYFLVLDLGVNGALGRLVAAHRAKRDFRAINEVVSTSLLLLSGVGLLVAIFTLLLPLAFFWLFEVPGAQADHVRLSLLVVGFTTALSFPGTVSYGFLWGYERFDLLNLVEIPTVLARTGLTLWLVHSEAGLLELACIVSGASIVSYAVRSVVCCWAEPKLRVGVRFFSRTVAADVFVFGFWFSLVNFSRATLPNVAPFVIGHGLGPAAVTTFTIPKMVTSYCSWTMLSASQVLAPRAAVYHFGRQHDKQEDLFLTGGRYAAALSLYFVGGAILLGMPFLDLWQRGLQGTEYSLLIVLIIGEAMPMSQWVTYNAIFSMGKHRRLAFFGIGEGLLTLTLSALVVSRYGLLGVAVAAAFSAFLFRGVLQWTYGCSLVGVPLSRYARLVFLPTLVTAAAAIAIFAVLRSWLVPTSWLALVLVGSLYTCLYWGLVLTQLPPLFRQDATETR